MQLSWEVLPNAPYSSSRLAPSDIHLLRIIEHQHKGKKLNIDNVRIHLESYHLSLSLSSKMAKG